MSHRIAVVSQKGGVGKTTIALNLAAALAERGLRSVLVDLDPQGAVALSLGRPDQAFSGVADVLMRRCELEQALLRTQLPGLTLLPRGRLSAVDAAEFEQALARPDVVPELLEVLGRDFDRVLVDTPAGLGLVTRAVLTSVDFALIPFQAEPLALRSIGQVLAVIEHVRCHENPGLDLLGILPTMVAMADEGTHATLAEIWTGFEGVLDSAIPRSPVFAEASRRGIPLAFLAGPVRSEARRFELLADEVEATIASLRDKEGLDAERPERSLL